MRVAPRGRNTGKSTRGASSGKPARPAAKKSSGGRAPAARTGRPAPARTGRAPARGARVGSNGATGAPRKPAEKGLGGEQVEGRQAVRELLIAQRRKVREIWFANDIDSAPIIEDIEQLAHASRITIQEVARKRLEERARSEAPQGVIAFAAPVPEASFADMLRGTSNTKPFLVAVDGVTDPGNLGALLRCCDGAGVTGVVLPRHRAVHVTPTVAKASAGAVEHVPMALVSGLPTAISQMREKGIWVVGLDDKGTRTLWDIGDLAREGICVVLGAEGAGLSRLVRERCDEVVSIPMRGQVSSLNVSAAAALATYEVARARLAGRS